jgi:hypothetical protein
MTIRTASSISKKSVYRSAHSAAADFSCNTLYVIPSDPSDEFFFNKPRELIKGKPAMVVEEYLFKPGAHGINEVGYVGAVIHEGFLSPPVSTDLSPGPNVMPL